jgi:hypothetical protein
MPRKGPAYPITPQWQGWVRDRIEEMKKTGDIKADLDIASRAGIAKSSLSGALKEGAVQSTVMPQIHKVLGWPPPLMTPPIHVLRLVEFFSRLSDFEQGQQLERLRHIVGEEREARVERDRDGAGSATSKSRKR